MEKRMIAATTPSSGHIAFKGIRVRFPSSAGQDVLVMDGFNLEIPAGEFVAIVGPSGCGKSTLLRVLSGLVDADAGTALIDGLTAEETAERIGFMFPRDTLLPWASVQDNIAIGLELAHAPAATAKERIRELIDFLKLTGFERNMPHQL